MNMTKLSVKDYIGIIAIPVVVYILWAVLHNIISLGIIMAGIYNILSIYRIIYLGVTVILGLILTLFVGWRTVKKYKGTPINAAIAGLVTGIICGVAIKIINLSGGLIPQLMYGFFPDIGFMMGFLFRAILLVIVNIIIGVFFGTILAVVGALIAEKM